MGRVVPLGGGGVDKPMNVALLGAGTVGAAVAELLLERSDSLSRKAGVPLRLKTVVVRDPGEASPGT